MNQPIASNIISSCNVTGAESNDKEGIGETNTSLLIQLLQKETRKWNKIHFHSDQSIVRS